MVVVAEASIQPQETAGPEVPAVVVDNGVAELRQGVAGQSGKEMMAVTVLPAVVTPRAAVAALVALV